MVEGRILAHEISRSVPGLGSRPTIGDYQVTFLLVQASPDTPRGGWQIERRSGRQVVTREVVAQELVMEG